MTQLEIVMFSGLPPPNRKTAHRVLKVLFVMVTFRQLPNSAGIVLSLHVAIGDVDMLAADEVKSVVVAVDAIIDTKAFHPYEAALNYPDRVKRAGDQVEVSDPEIPAAVKQQVIRTIGSPSARRWRNAPGGTPELRALAVDRPRPFDGDVLRVDREDQTDVSVAECGVTAERDGIRRVVLLSVRAAQQFSLSGDSQRHIAFELDGADDKHSGGDEHRSPLVFVAGVDSILERLCGKGLAVSFRAETDDVVDAGAACRLSSLGRSGQQSRAERSR
jgi:hypothetical protein